MANFFDQFDEEETTQPTDAPRSPDPLASGNYFDQFDDAGEETNYFDQFGFGEPEPEPEIVPEEDGIRYWDQFVGGFYDDRARENILSAVNTAKEVMRVRESMETGEPLAPQDKIGGVLGVSGRDITRYTRTLTPEGREKYESQLLKNLQDRIDTAMEYKAKGEEIPFSPETQQFLDENSENGILEDFWAAPYTIIAELGIRSAVPSLKGAAAGTAAGLVGGVAGPAGATAGFAGGMGAMSARTEYAASVMQGLQEAGVDLADATSIIEAIANEDLIEDIQRKAATRAAIIGGVDSITGGLAGKAIPSPVKGTLAKEMVNLAGQTGIQVLGGGGGEALAQYATEGEVAWREVAAEAAGELVTAPVDVAAAVAAGARGDAQADLDQDSALAEIERIQREAEEQAMAAGADPLEAAMAGAAAAGEAGDQVQDVFTRAAEQLTEEELQAAEQADEAARAEMQEEAAATYEAQVAAAEQEAAKTAAFEEAEAAAVAQKEVEVKEAELQREVQAGEQIEAIREPEEARPKLAAVVPEEVKAAVAEKAKPRPTRKAKVEPVAMIEDKTPDVVVDAAGVAMSRAQIDAERRRLQVDVAAGETPLPPSELKMERRLGDMRIAIETPEGNTRTGRKPTGETWSATMRGVDYGFIRGTTGADADQIDAFVSTRPGIQTDTVFVIDQINQDTGAFDEHKAMIGFRNQADAVRAYKRHYEAGWQVGPVTEMPRAEFETWVREGRRDVAVSAELQAIPATEADVEAMAERQVAKGRRKPKILYKLPEGYQVQTTTEEAMPVTGVQEMNLELVDEAGAVRGGITADVIPADRQIKVAVSKVDEDLQGRGIGIEMYNHLLKEANARGFELVSDTSVSAAAERVYQALERRGATVLRNPAARRNERGDLLSDDIRNPVFRVMPTDIQLAAGDVRAVSGRGRSALAMIDARRAEPTMDTDTIEDIVAVTEAYIGIRPELQATVVENPADLPDVYYEALAEKDNLDARGFYDRSSGKVFLIAANNLTIDEALKTILHEGVAHRGLEVVLGEKRIGLLDDVWENGNQDAIGKIAKRYDFDLSNLEERRNATEEYIAELAERTPNAPILRRIIDAVRAFLRELGVLDQWTDSDIHALLRDVARELKGRPLNQIEITTTAEIEETGEVVEIARQADVVLRQHDKRAGVVQALKDCL